jgi:hypothetical protein
VFGKEGRFKKHRKTEKNNFVNSDSDRILSESISDLIK